MGACSGGEETTQNAAVTTNTQEQVVREIEKEENVPMEYRQALKKAQSYINHMAFSEKDLRGQLQYHEFSTEAINYAMENIVVNYTDECVDKAQSYLDNLAMSEQDLRGQLQYHEFSNEDIEYAIEKVYK